MSKLTDPPSLIISELQTALKQALNSFCLQATVQPNHPIERNSSNTIKPQKNINDLDALTDCALDLTEAFRNQKFIIALSGGLDSVVLLDLMAVAIDCNWLDVSQVHAIYIDHQLQAVSADWGIFCEKLCHDYGINFQKLTVTVKDKPRQGLEKNAREARYQALFSQASLSDVVLTAHHADDQAETVLLNLMRGAGVRGLAAMPQVRQTQKGWLLRPLLSISRQKIFDYAQLRGLHWVEDPSNLNIDYRRNWLRQKIFPELSTQFPNVASQLSTSAEYFQEADFLLKKLAAQQLQLIHSKAGELPSSSFFVLPSAISQQTSLEKGHRSVHFSELKNMLRYWAESNGLPKFSQSSLHWVLQTAFESKKLYQSKPHESGVGPDFKQKIMPLKKPLNGKYALNANESWQLYQNKLYFVPNERAKYFDLATFMAQLASVKDHETCCDHEVLETPLAVTAQLPIWLNQQNATTGNTKTNQIDLFKDVFVVSYQHLVASDQVALVNGQQGIHKKRLKEFFQSHVIPVWLRQNWPFLIKADVDSKPYRYEIVGVLGDRKVLRPSASGCTDFQWLQLDSISYHDYLKGFHQVNFLAPTDFMSCGQ